MRPDCKARRVLDEYHCVECALRWGASEDPPACNPSMTAKGVVRLKAEQDVRLDKASDRIKRALRERFG